MPYHTRAQMSPKVIMTVFPALVLEDPPSPNLLCPVHNENTDGSLESSSSKPLLSQPPQPGQTPDSAVPGLPHPCHHNPHQAAEKGKRHVWFTPTRPTPPTRVTGLTRGGFESKLQTPPRRRICILCTHVHAHTYTHTQSKGAPALLLGGWVLTAGTPIKVSAPGTQAPRQLQTASSFWETPHFPHRRRVPSAPVSCGCSPGLLSGSLSGRHHAGGQLLCSTLELHTAPWSLAGTQQEAQSWPQSTRTQLTPV